MGQLAVRGSLPNGAGTPFNVSCDCMFLNRRRSTLRSEKVSNTCAISFFLCKTSAKRHFKCRRPARSQCPKFFARRSIRVSRNWSQRFRLKMSAPKFSEQHLRLINKNFKLLDDDKDGKLDQIQFATLFRSLGQTISEAKMDSLVTEIFTKIAKENERAADAAAASEDSPPPPRSENPDISNVKVNLQQFVAAFLEHYQPPTSETVLRQAFQVFDPQNTGKMNVARLEELMTQKGEPLPSNELQEILQLANVKGKSFDYAALAEKLSKGPGDVSSV